MNDERQLLGEACGELETGLRKAFVVALEGWQQQEQAEEAIAWQAAWENWTQTVEAAAASIKVTTGVDKK